MRRGDILITDIFREELQNKDRPNLNQVRCFVYAAVMTDSDHCCSTSVIELRKYSIDIITSPQFDEEFIYLRTTNGIPVLIKKELYDRLPRDERVIL